jgi:MFS family permease
LLGLLLIFFLGNLFSGIALSTAALFPMILLRTGNDTQAVGIIQSMGALMAVLSALFLTGWGGIKRPINAILLGWILSSMFGLTFLGMGQIFLIWLMGMGINAIFEPVVNVAMDTFLQTKIPPEVQGRVFSASDFFSQALIPFTPLLAGLFGDRIFEPAMREGGRLTDIFGGLVGTGPGAGFGLLILLCGVGGTFIGLSGYLVKEIRDLDQEMPDYRLPPIGLIPRTEPLLAVNAAPYEATSAPSYSNGPLEQNNEEASNEEENQNSHPEE